MSTVAGPAGKSGKGKLVGLGVVLGLVAGAGVYFRRLAKNKSVSPAEFHAAQKDDIDWVLYGGAERRGSPLSGGEEGGEGGEGGVGAREGGVVGVGGGSGGEKGGEGDAFGALLDGRTKVVLYAYSACPFSGKIRTFLRYFRVPFEEVEVEPMFKSQIAGVAYSKIPQLTLEREGVEVRLVDSEAMVDYLAPLVVADAAERAQVVDAPGVDVWRTWAQEELVRLIVVYINQSLPSAVAGYAYIDRFDAIPWYNKAFLKAVGAPVMYMVAKFVTRKRLAKLGYSDDDLDKIDTLYAQVDKFVAHGLADQPFHGGNAPDLVDIDVFGIISAMQGHPVHASLRENTGIDPWLARMENALAVRAI